MKLPHIKKPTKKTIGLIGIGLALLAAAIAYFSLPGITENYLLAQAEKFGLKNLRFKAIHVGWRRLGLSGVTVGDATAPALSIPYLSVDYSLAGLWQKKIKHIRLIGAWIKLEDRGQGFAFRGMAAAQSQGGKMITVERLSLKDGSVRFAWAGRSLEIPVEGTLRASGADYIISARLLPLAETVQVQGKVNKEFSAGKIGFTAPGFPLQTLIDQAGFASSARASGRIAAAGEITLAKGTFKAAAVSLSALEEVRLAVADSGAVTLDSLSLAFSIGGGFTARDIVVRVQGHCLRFGALAIDAPFQVESRGSQWPEMQFSVRALQVARPLPLSVERLDGRFSGPWETARISGNFRLQSASGMLAALGLPAEFSRPLALDGDFQGRFQPGSIVWTMKARGNSEVAVAQGQMTLRGWLDLDADVSGDAARLHLRASCRLARAELHMPGYRAQAAELGSSVELDYAYGENFHSRGLLDVRAGDIAADAGQGLEAAGIRLHLPWQWPGNGPGAEGRFFVAHLQSSGTRWQDISGRLTQKGAALRFSGSLSNALKKIVVAFQGQIGPLPDGEDLQAEFQVLPVVLSAGTALQPLHPLLQGTSGSGRFQAQGRISTGKDGLNGSASIKIVDADFERQKEGIALRGLNAKIELDRLFAFVSAPAQRLTFRELQWQEILLSNGELVFASEPGGTLWIESSRFEWCQGKITMAPFRLEPGANDFLMTFYCDRVNFAQMLNALVGKTIVSGDAEMNGIVPVKMVKGSPVFQDGYLYSTPGRSGNLKVSQPELIANGQALVEEAIRDFRYNWIKVKLSSRNDRLDMVVSMDGAPAQKLPLRYDPKAKNFIKDLSGGRHVELKGLLLDINFSDIDLKDLLKASSQMTSSHQEKK